MMGGFYDPVSILTLNNNNLSGGVAKWLRHSIANLVQSSILDPSPTVGTMFPQANSQLSFRSFRGQ